MVPAKDPPKVKLENFHNSRVQELREIMRTLFMRAWWFL